MKFNTVKELNDEQFRPLTGVKRPIFDKIVGILEDTIKNRRTARGRKKKLGIEDMLLMTLEYILKYRTYFHVSQSYGISESSTYKAVKWVDDIATFFCRLRTHAVCLFQFLSYSSGKRYPKKE